MSWLNPGFLWFMAGGSIPVIIHLLNRQRYRRVRWAAMEWLLAALKKTRRRLQIENLLLLLLRILIMVILAFALARPYLTGVAGAIGEESDTHYLLAIDTSYSMEYKRGGVASVDLAKNACHEFLRTVQPSSKDRFTLMTLSASPTVPKQGSNDLTLIGQAIDEVRAGPQDNNMIASFGEIQKLLDRNLPETPKNPARKVYLFTDLQRNAWEFPDEPATRRFSELAKTLSQQEGTWFHIVDVGSPNAPNVAIVDLRVTQRVLTYQKPVDVVVELYNFSPDQPAKDRKVQLLVDGLVFETKTVSLPAGGLGVVKFEREFTERDVGPHGFEARLDPQHLFYDTPSVDNHRYLAVEVKEGLRGLLVDGEPKDGKRLNRETGAFERVLQKAGTFKAEWVTLPNFDSQKLREFDFVALCNVKSLTSDVLEKLEEFVEHGGGLFVSLGNQVDAVWYNREMATCNGTIVEESGKGRRCRKCGIVNPRDEEVTTERRRDPSGKEIATPVHGAGRGLLPATLAEVVGTPPDLHQSGVPRRLSKVDLDHRIFSLFREVAKAQPYQLVFWKFFRTEGYDSANVLAEFDDARHSPLLLERDWHEGKVVLMTSAIDAEEDWNAGIIGRPPYPPLVLNLCEYLASRPASRRNFFVGERLIYHVPYDVQNQFQLYPPQGSPITVIAERRAPEDVFMEILYGAGGGLDRTGKYTLVRQGGVPEEHPVAHFGVNVGPRELTPDHLRLCDGHLEVISSGELKRRYPEFKVEFLGEKSERGDEVKFTPPESELWRKLLFVLLGFLVVESLLACLFGRKKQ